MSPFLITDKSRLVFVSVASEDTLSGLCYVAYLNPIHTYVRRKYQRKHKYKSVYTSEMSIIKNKDIRRRSVSQSDWIHILFICPLTKNTFSSLVLT